MRGRWVVPIAWPPPFSNWREEKGQERVRKKPTGPSPETIGKMEMRGFPLSFQESSVPLQFSNLLQMPCTPLWTLPSSPDLLKQDPIQHLDKDFIRNW